MLKDFRCNDPICGTLDIIGSVYSAVGLAVIGHISSTKSLTTIIGSVTVGLQDR